MIATFLLAFSSLIFIFHFALLLTLSFYQLFFLSLSLCFYKLSPIRFSVYFIAFVFAIMTQLAINFLSLDIYFFFLIPRKIIHISTYYLLSRLHYCFSAGFTFFRSFFDVIFFISFSPFLFVFTYCFHY